MAEYYPLLAKAIASLPNSTPESRKVVYERARKALIGQLRTLHPPVADDDIERESVALDRAVERLEGELAGGPGSATAPAASAPVPPAMNPPPAVKPSPEPAKFPANGGALGPVPAKPLAPLRTKLPPPRSPKPSAIAPSLVPASPVSEAPVVLAPGPAPDGPAGVEPAVPATEPPVAPQVIAPVEMPAKPRPEPQRPIAPQPPVPKGPKRPLWIIPAGIGLVVLLVGLAAYKLRDRPETLTRNKTAEQQAPADASKIVERVGGPSPQSDGTTRSAADQSASPSGQTGQQPANQPGANNPAAPVAGRAALLVEAPDEPNKIKTYLGTVVWRLDNVSDGQNQAVGLAVRAEVDLPEDKLKAIVIFQKNLDASLPASHTMKVRFLVQPGSPTGSVKEINVPQMRREDSATGDSLDGVTVPIVENSFLIGLTPGNAESANLELLRAREWIDIPIRLSSTKIAKLTFEKTAAGQRDIQEAIVAWSKP